MRGETIFQLILFILLCPSLMAFLLSRSMRWTALHFWLSLSLISGLFFSANQIIIGTACLFIAFFSFCLHLFYGLATFDESAAVDAPIVAGESKNSGRLQTGFYAITSMCLSVIIAIAFTSAKSRISAETPVAGSSSIALDIASVLMNRQFFSMFLVLLLGLALVLCWSEILGLEQRFERGKGAKKE